MFRPSFFVFSVGYWFPTDTMVANFSLPVAAKIHSFFTLSPACTGEKREKAGMAREKNPNIFPVPMHKSGTVDFMHST